MFASVFSTTTPNPLRRGATIGEDVRRMGDAHRFLVGIVATRTARVVGDVRALFPRGFGVAFARTSLVKLAQHRDALERLSDRSVGCRRMFLCSPCGT